MYILAWRIGGRRNPCYWRGRRLVLFLLLFMVTQAIEVGQLHATTRLDHVETSWSPHLGWLDPVERRERLHSLAMGGSDRTWGPIY